MVFFKSVAPGKSTTHPGSTNWSWGRGETKLNRGGSKELGKGSENNPNTLESQTTHTSFKLKTKFF